MGDPTLDDILRRREQATRHVLTASKAAKEIRDILAGAMPQREKNRQISRRLQTPQGSTEKVWLRAVETSYNHDPPEPVAHKSRKCYTIVSFEGKPYEVAHVEPYTRNYGVKLRLDMPSPLREDLQHYLAPDDARQIIARLERATRFRKLTAGEAARAVLSKGQREVAVSRAQGARRPLAQWLFDEKNWTYLVTTAAKWKPSEAGGFFEQPALVDLVDWPKRLSDQRAGDRRYLDTIAGDFASLRKTIYGYISAFRQVMSGLTATNVSGDAREILAWAETQLILEARKKLHLLRSNTKKQEILISKLVDIKIIWIKDLPSDARKWKAMGLLE